MKMRDDAASASVALVEMVLPGELPVPVEGIETSWHRFFKIHDSIGRSDCKLKRLMQDIWDTRRCDDNMTSEYIYK
jgi:hypothetical protein